MAREVASPATPALTADGVERLCGRAPKKAGAVLVQVLGVYRYAVDPALKTRVGPALAAKMELDAFDLLVSDGRHKMKCLLSPTLSHLVWKRRVHPLDVVSIAKFEALEDAGAADGARQQRVVVVHQLKVMASAGNVRKKIVRASAGISFISSEHPREVALVPLAGERRYYLPLSSDHYSLDRGGSFTGKLDKWSPPGELEAGPPELSNVEWVRQREECASLFSKAHRRVLTISEVTAAVNADRASGSEKPPPPMVGTIRVKSKVTHLGDPDIASAFPFVFHIVLVDCISAVEVAFYGSMCAKYFFSLEEGDLVQLRGYRVVPLEAVNPEYKGSSPVYMFENKSSGSVRHVPEKYWRMLKVTGVIPHPTPMLGSDDGEEEGAKPNMERARKRPLWLELALATTQDVQLWSGQSRGDQDQLFFDFVGVLSFVGKICRRRKHDSQEFTERRWVKAIDASSAAELVIQVDECSQPAVFRALEAGAAFMATKLRRTAVGSDGMDAIQYASTSSLSVLRVNDDISPFFGVEACRLNSQFARTIKEKTELAIMKTRGETRLGGYTMKQYQPINSMPTDANAFMKTFGVSPLSFSQLRKIHDRMETFECQHAALIAPVRAITSRGKAIVEREANIFLALGDVDDLDMRLTVRVAINPLFRSTPLPDIEDPSALAESLPLMRIMSPSMLRSLVSRPLTMPDGRIGAAKRRLSVEALKLDAICEWMTKQGRGNFFFSLRMFRNSDGHVEWVVDAIFPAP